MAIQAQLYNQSLGFSLCGNNNNIINNNNMYCIPQDFMSEIGDGCGVLGSLNNLSYNPQHQQPQMVLQDFQRSNQRTEDTIIPTTYSQSQSQPQTMFDDVDQFIKDQNERLRMMIQEQKKRQVVTLMKKIGPKLSGELRSKDEEISRATKRTTELETLLRRLESENVSWRRIVEQSEARAASLSIALEEATRERCRFAERNDNNNVAEDAGSCCDGGDETAGRLESTGCGDCRSCGKRESCVLFLPCRHFCSCKDCEAFLDSCPVCRQPKKAIIEALPY